MSPVSLWRSVINTVKSFGLSALLAFVVLFILSLLVNCALLYYVGGTLFLASILANFVVKWMPKERISHERKAVFITGCDRGFGYMLAQRLDDIGFHVFAGCLFPDGDGAANLRKSGSDRLHVFGLDVSSDTSVQEAAAYVKENLKPNVLWAVVNNAGIFQLSEVPWTSMETIQRITEVNTMGVVRVTKAFLMMLKESKGRIVTVASTAGRHVSPGLAPYCMSKSAVISFCDCLRLEMYKWNIQVVTIEPTFFRTLMTSEKEIRRMTLESWDSASKDVKDMYRSDYMEEIINRALRLMNLFGRPPSDVVSVMEEAVTALHPQYSYVPGSLLSRLTFWFLARLPKPVADMFVFYGTYGTDLR